MSSPDATVVVVNATAVKDALKSLNGSNSTNASAANATAANATAAAPATAAGADADTTPAKKGVPMLFWIWGGYSVWSYVAASLTYNAYGSFATTLNTNKISGNTAWTVSYIKGKAPVSTWLNTSLSVLSLQTVSIIAWILGILKMKVPFLLLFKISQLFPIIEMILWLYVYTSYTACDNSSLTSTQFDGTTTTVTQIVSCKNADKSTTTKARFGDSGTWAKKVNSDPYNTWFMVDFVTAVGLGAVGGAALGPVTSYFGKNGSNATNATAADAPAAAAANATAASANATAANASNASSGNGSKSVNVDITINKGGDSGSGADWNTPADDATAEPEQQQNCGFWGCL